MIRAHARCRRWDLLAVAGLAAAVGVEGAASLPLHAQEVRAMDSPRSSTPIRVDGVADEVAWASAPWSQPFVDIRGGAQPTPTWATRVQLLWDDRYLYIHADIQEPDLWATLTEHDAIVWRDDDFEVFLDPDGDGLDYYEVEVNALGTVLDLFLARPYHEGGHAELAWDVPGLQVGVHLRGTVNDPADRDEGWGVELAIPWADLTAPGSGVPGRPPEEGDVWRVNFSRVDWPLVVEAAFYRKATEGAAPGTHPEGNWVWSPQGVIDMHRPERWGRVTFVSNGQGRP